jgi:glycosyltransferase involved in cell wall biosynthesis
MKLLYITNGINGSGGLERVLSIKASMLAEQFDYEVHILVLNKAHLNLFYQFSPKIHMHSIEVNSNPFIYFKNYVVGLKIKIDEIKPDIISVCDDGFKAFLLPVILQKPCKMIYERHVSKNIFKGKNDSYLKKIITKIQFALMNYFAKKYDRFIVLTAQNKNEWKLKNIEVIPNPLTFYPDEIAKLENKKVIAVGKQSYQKGYDLLLLAWQKVVAVYPSWKLEIYGKYDASQELELKAKQLEIEKTITFFEPVKNIEAIYLQSSIYVMSSRFEGFGMVLIEAMACGVPCVSFDCPYGPSDIISHNEDGYIVKNYDTEQLSKQIKNLIENEFLRKEFGAKARENVKRFSAEIVVNKWHSLFKSL